MRLEMEGGGVLEVGQPCGGWVSLRAGRKADGAGIYKVWLTAGGSPALLLGTLAPQGDGLRLERQLTRDHLERAGCWPVEGAVCRLAIPFGDGAAPGWRQEPHPERRLSDPVLIRTARQWGGMLLREEAGGFRLAAPWRTACPFPMVPLFCLGQVEQIEGKSHVVFAFDREGRPIVPEENKSAATGTSGTAL